MRPGSGTGNVKSCLVSFGNRRSQGVMSLALVVHSFVHFQDRFVSLRCMRMHVFDPVLIVAYSCQHSMAVAYCI